MKLITVLSLLLFISCTNKNCDCDKVNKVDEQKTNVIMSTKGENSHNIYLTDTTTIITNDDNSPAIYAKDGNVTITYK